MDVFFLSLTSLFLSSMPGMHLYKAQLSAQQSQNFLLTMINQSATDKKIPPASGNPAESRRYQYYAGRNIIPPVPSP